MENNFNSNDQNNLLLSRPVEKLGFRIMAKRVKRKSGLLRERQKFFCDQLANFGS